MTRQIGLLLCLAIGCDTTPTPEAISLLGVELFPPELSAEALESRTAQLAEAQAEYDAQPTDADAIIWRGRRTAYLGRYLEAIEIFSEGINQHPEDPRMYRHRAHRYLTTRQFQESIADFEEATRLIDGMPDAVEPDGQPNSQNIPTGTTQSNIWYHLGLAYYLTQQYDKALGAFEAGERVSTSNDTWVAMTYWNFMSLARLNRSEDAAALLGTVAADLEIIENDVYHELLLLFRGDLEYAEVVDTSGDGDIALANATVGYGIGFWHELNGRPDDALATWNRIIEGSSWAGFGYIASEAEVARSQ